MGSEPAGWHLSLGRRRAQGAFGGSEGLIRDRPGPPGPACACPGGWCRGGGGGIAGAGAGFASAGQQIARPYCKDQLAHPPVTG